MKPILIAIIPLIASAGSAFPNLRLASKTTACSSSLPPASFVLSSRSRSALSFRNTKPAIPSIMKDKEQDSSRALHSSLSRSNESTNDITEIIRAESQCQMSILAERFPTVSSSESNQPSLTTLYFQNQIICQNTLTTTLMQSYLIAMVSSTAVPIRSQALQILLPLL